jgi:hypothetical protein
MTMPHPHETKHDNAAAKYVEARRLWQAAHDVALREAGLAGAKAQATETTTAVGPLQAARPRGDAVRFRSYGAARDALVDQLLQDAGAHDAGRFDEIGRPSDRIELPRVGPPELMKLRVALSFWDAWVDARNHDWQLGGDIGKAEWPTLARRIASDLAEGREISDARVGTRFDISTRRTQG